MNALSVQVVRGVRKSCPIRARLLDNESPRLVLPLPRFWHAKHGQIAARAVQLVVTLRYRVAVLFLLRAARSF